MTTDYGKINGIVLSYPQDFHDPFYNKLTGFYDELISMLPQAIKLCLIVNSQRVKQQLTGRFHERDINIIVVPEFEEIWLRDLLGFPSGKQIIKPVFQPTYFKNIYTKSYLARIDSQVNSILQQLDFEVVPLDLIWDGGNLIHNDKIGFITDKVLRDNPNKSESKIESLIENNLKIKPIFVPTERHDQLGHVDGYMNFIQENIITISNYPNIQFLRGSVSYREALLRVMSDEGLTTIDIWDRPILENVNVGDEYLESSRGVHNNFIQINDTLILPKYHSPKDSLLSDYNGANINALKPYFSTIRTINSDELAKLGGVLHCVSWCW